MKEKGKLYIFFSLLWAGCNIIFKLFFRGFVMLLLMFLRLFVSYFAAKILTCLFLVRFFRSSKWMNESMDRIQRGKGKGETIHLSTEGTNLKKIEKCKHPFILRALVLFIIPLIISLTKPPQIQQNSGLEIQTRLNKNKTSNCSISDIAWSLFYKRIKFLGSRHVDSR